MDSIINGVQIKAYERVDDLQRNGLRIIQDPKRFCFGMDSVLLTGFIKLKKREALLDLGTGTGVIPILMTAKSDGACYHGLEIQPESAEMAARSVKLNGLEHLVTITQGDIKDMSGLYKAASFDVVTTNPPYMKHGGGLVNDFSPRAIARHELLCSLEDIISGAAMLLKPRGRFYMIHRPHRLADILITLRTYKLEPKQLRFVVSRTGDKPCMILICAVRGGNPDLTVLNQLVIYGQDGNYTDEVLSLYNG